MDIKEYLKNNVLYLDGAMGTVLQSLGLKGGELPEMYNITDSEKIISVHKAYFDAGSNVVLTNTFGANSLKFEKAELEKIIPAAVNNARAAADKSETKGKKWVALDIGPTGKMLKPLGDLDFEDAVNVFAQTVKIGAQNGADLIFIETMSDIYETKAALLAAKENCDLPVFVSNAYGTDGKLLTGASPLSVIATLEGLGADAIGVNCSFGPKQLKGIIEQYLKYSSVPVIFKPNAGLPQVKDGQTVFDVGAKEFAEDLSEIINMGVKIVGGCCGTSPEYIKAVTEKTIGLSVEYSTKKDYTVVSSYAKAQIFGDKPVLIGERINPTGKKELKSALISGDIDYILKEGIAEQEKGAHILDVNVGINEIDEAEVLPNTVCALQSVCDLPLQIDTANVRAMEKSLRIYNGKPLINSVNGKEESLNAVLPLAKKYGGVLIALTLDENGIPKTAEGRVEIAKKILLSAQKIGIDKKDIIFDPLALTVSADKDAAKETLKAIKLLNEMGLKTSLGVSNVSFGLPMRELLNSSFFTAALFNGLNAAIINPYSEEMIKAYNAFLSLNGLDENFENYIAFANGISAENTSVKDTTVQYDLDTAIKKGLKDAACIKTKELINEYEPLKIVNEMIIPALDFVGAQFEKGTLYLPQLLMSAEAAKSAFEVIKAKLTEGKTKTDNTVPFVIATVKGDIHDIGKNIVKLLLENYGFDVYDLGKDVPPEKIAQKTVELKAPLVGLSALMTTTVPSMEKTLKLLKEKAPWCKTVVGGAVLTEEYAKKIGADKYAKDAMETVRFAETVRNNK